MIAFEWGLDLAALLFFPLLILAPRGIAALASVAGLFAAGLILAANRPLARRHLAVPAALVGALLIWGTVSAIWSIDPLRSLDLAARLAGLFAAGLALAAAAGEVAAPGRLTGLLVAGFVLGLAMAAVDLASHGALSKPFSTRPYEASWLNQASVAFAILLLPTSAALVGRGRRAAGVLFAGAAAATILALAGTAAKVALAAGLPAALLCYGWRARTARAAALLSVAVVISAPLTFARLERVSDLVATANDVKQSAGHRLLIWSFVGDRIAEHPLARLGPQFLARDPGRQGSDPARRELAAVAPARRALAAVARARRAGCGADGAVDRICVAGAGSGRGAAALCRGCWRQPGLRLCRHSRHLRHLGGMVAGNPMVLPVPGSGDGPGRGGPHSRPACSPPASFRPASSPPDCGNRLTRVFTVRFAAG